MSSLDALLSPQSIAIVGASARPGHFGNQPFVNLRNFGFQGKVWGVDRAHPEIEGYPCVATIEDLPEGVDHAVVVLPASRSVDAVSRLAARGVRSATVVASGFAEEGTS